ncbi:hypothetical protein JIN85_07825 [Luteolibacter pohnpeiensis]|uniref:NfeD-like C-terminal domain-containing protein n=1 Tax=Luteolibacter pohnpeiensis TaxID=454153 RepID=A0A934SBM2_9BACT|nr:NfeD family protein [Luteolibacter pohnpeiensis]MBK1882318.1 hypothetical protein [Luteolibacter pohnpeiensis]
MMMVSILFLLGIVALVVEVIIPGGILGAIGALLMLIGCGVAFSTFGALGGLVAIFTAILLAGITFYLEFRVLPKTKIGRRAFLSSEVRGVSAAFGTEARELIGKTAEALTLLSPSGYVRIDGQRYEAFCQSGQAPVGSALEVIDADNFRLIVKKQSILS